ncbi:hypothetical protein WJX74_007508 [Apatococcus lobatus]|uniref:BolA-like protein n=2 Tax=Apatococcus TaxID=904362 RepID=A0AAW1SP22_9CHLO
MPLVAFEPIAGHRKFLDIKNISAAAEMPTAANVEQALRTALQARDVTVIDSSSGCGTSFTVAVISDQFEGKKSLQRHRMVNDALKPYMDEIHALSIKHCWTQEQQAAATNK